MAAGDVADAELHLVQQLCSSSPGPVLVVLVHGALDRSTSFVRAMRHLAGVDVVAYDRRGYARSLHAGATDRLDVHVDDVLSVVDRCRRGEAVVVVGHSIGGDIAIAAACRAPGLIAAVGAFEPPMPWMPDWPETTAGSAAVFADGDAGDAAEVFLRRMIGEETWATLSERTKRDRRLEGPALLGDLRSIRQEPPFDVTRIPVPVILGYGSEGPAHQRANVERLATLVPDVEVAEIADAGHGAHRSHPIDFADFVRRVVRRGAVAPA